MLRHPIRTAQKSGLFDEIYVSTESAEIAEIASQAGVKVIQRPSQLAEDRSTVVQVCLHALDTYPEIERLCCIYATAILLKPESLIQSYTLLDTEPVADFVMGVSNYEHPPVQALKVNDYGYLSYMWPEWRGVQSQFHPPLVVSNGTFYWANRPPFTKEKTFYGNRLKGYVVPPEQVSDVNTPEDLENIISILSNNHSLFIDY